MKTAKANISLEINVECPHCEDYIDLLDIQYLCDDGYIYNKCLSSTRSWGCDDFNEEVECPSCNKQFKVGNVVW